MSSRSAKLVNAALSNKVIDELHTSAPSTSGIQYFAQEPRKEVWSDFDSDDSVLDKNYEPPKRCDPNYCIESNDSDTECDFIPCSQEIQHRTILESPELLSDRETNEMQLLTKRGNIRKRKKYAISLIDRKILKNEEKVKSKYFIKPGCHKNICKKKCSESFSEDFRKIINKNFWKMSWMEQKYFYLCNTSIRKPDRPKNKDNDINHKGKCYTRSKTISYFFNDENGDKVSVCRTFFLTTLGYNQNNCKAIRNVLDRCSNYESKLYPKPLIDGRGRNPNPNKIDPTNVIKHIMSFNPVISHYRREHAPNKRYLPSDLTIRLMYRHYCNSDPQIEISYIFYRNLIKQLNISFTKLGHEECEQCEKFIIHNPHREMIRHRNCKECKDYEAHRERYISARKKYKDDADNQTHEKIETETIIFAVDLEKIIMLPRMEEFKTVMFCPRLIVFNQSFVPIGDKHMHDKGLTFAALWHEAVSGRKKEDIVSCFKAFFVQNRDLKHIILWLDNCAAQNKNWTLYSYLVYLVNSGEVNFETITLRYLETGHTFMAADEFHHRVERSLKTKKRVYDFEDFCKAVSDTGSRTTVKKMEVIDFFDYEDCSSTVKIKNSNPRAYMNGISEANFRKGSKLLFYKNSHGTEEYLELDFLKLKFSKQGMPSPRHKLVPRGIASGRKSAILTKLGPLMPSNRKVFWETLPVNDQSVDLIENYED